MGIHLEPFRQQMRRQGQRVRWFKAMPASYYNPKLAHYDRGSDTGGAGQTLVEQVLDPAIRVLIGNLKKAYEHPEFGIIETGTCTISVMPDELRLGNQDQLVLLDRRELVRERVTQTLDGSDVPSALLTQLYPSELLNVWLDGTPFVVDTDVWLDTTNPRLLVWADPSAAPDAGVAFAAEYLCNPVYWFLFADETPPAPNPTFGGELPQKGFLVRKWPGDI